jgi:hypothetical protein
MFLPVRGRYRVCTDGYAWSPSKAALRQSSRRDAPAWREMTISETSVPQWQPVVSAQTNMAVELANVDTDDAAGIEAFVNRWGLPVIENERKPASMTVADFFVLVGELRSALAYASWDDVKGFGAHLTYHAFFAQRPHYEPNGAPGAPPIHVECRDLASLAWLQLAQREGSRAEYRRCGWCRSHFTVADRDGHRRSRQYCSDRCRVAANRSKKRGVQAEVEPPVNPRTQT